MRIYSQARGAPDAGAERAGHDHARGHAARARAGLRRLPALTRGERAASGAASSALADDRLGRGARVSERRHPARGPRQALRRRGRRRRHRPAHPGAASSSRMLGPSGCGKTTTLRLIAGFEQPDAGAILLDGVDMSRTPPHKRRVNTVFQSYALFPHMTVADNVAFGLRYQRATKAEVKRARRRGDGRSCSSAASSDAAPGAALRRPAAARRAGARARARAAGAAARRAARRARRAPARRPAGRAQAHPGAARGHVRLRHARPGRGADDERPRRGHARAAASSSAARRSELYEEPATAFVANFLGASNLVPVAVAGPDGDGRSSGSATSRCAPRRSDASAGRRRWR